MDICPYCKAKQSVVSELDYKNHAKIFLEKYPNGRKVPIWKRDEKQIKIKCPTCNSTKVEKISTRERVLSVAILGLFSKKINKSFKCKNCGYTW